MIVGPLCRPCRLGAPSPVAANKRRLSDRIGRTSWWHSGGPHAPAAKPFYTHLYIQVLTADRHRHPAGPFSIPVLGEQMKPLGDGFIKLIKMMIAPIIFCTRRARHRQHGGHEEGRTCRPQSIDLLRSGNHARAHRRTCRGQRSAARRPGMNVDLGSDRYQIDPGLHHQGRASRAPSNSCSTSYPTRWLARLPKAKILQVLFFAIPVRIRTAHDGRSAGKARHCSN